jgi:hypothetical protein
MLTREVDVKIILIKAYCDECEGTVKYTGEAFMTCPPLYIHECDDCGKVFKVRGEIYPITTTKEYSR